jgi:hypothetical protein
VAFFFFGENMESYKTLCYLLREYSMATDINKVAIAEQISQVAQQLVTESAAKVSDWQQLELRL